MTLQTELFSAETSDFLKQMIFLNLFNSVFYMSGKLGHPFESTMYLIPFLKKKPASLQQASRSAKKL